MSKRRITGRTHVSTRAGAKCRPKNTSCVLGVYTCRKKSISAGRGLFWTQLSGDFGKLAETARPEAQLAFADHVRHFDPGQRRGC